MDNKKSLPNIAYMIRHLLTANITDPLTESERGVSELTQYFCGTNVAGQINYLERKPASSGRFQVFVNGTLKTPTTDYTLSTSALTITWGGYTPPTGNDNIKVVYQAVNAWIFDARDNITRNFPIIEVDCVDDPFETYGMGEYHNYSSGLGNKVTARFNLMIKSRMTTNEPYTFTYNNLHYERYQIADAIAEAVALYLNTNRFNAPWRFFDWELKRSEPVHSEEDFGVIRRDVLFEAQYFHVSS